MIRSLAVLTAALVPASASAFCGFYVAGGGAELFNNATQVVLMRQGTRTVLSMQNNYQGPPADFAMVVPVPVVLQKENVKTLSRSIFDKIDKLAAPRLVEYWEQDPCFVPVKRKSDESSLRMKSAAPSLAKKEAAADYGVTIEAKFEVGEYEVVILSAKEALGLEAYLKAEKYRIPSGAGPLFKPYIQQGMKFFVAKVNAAKVKFENGQATLSPLRFHYDSEQFSLPVRLGLINAKDKQDLIVHVLAPKQRYEVANAPNVTIPTNIDLVPSTKSEFGPFYASLFDRTQKAGNGAVVTEYAWDSATCDPCPIPPLNESDLMILGLDVLYPSVVEPQIEVKNLDKLGERERQVTEQGVQNVKRSVLNMQLAQAGAGGSRFVLTRLHARYDKSSLAEDLVFRAAPPIAGGREHLSGPDGLEQGAVAHSVNNFQGRYAIRYPWTGPVACSNPVRGRWGANPNGGASRPTAAQDTAFAPRDRDLAGFVESPVPELQVPGKKAKAGLPLGVQGGAK